MKRNRIFLGVFVLIITMGLTACDKRIVFLGSDSIAKNKIEASYRLFSGTDEKRVKLKSGETLAIDYQSEVEKGALTMRLYDPDNQLLKDLGTDYSGNEKIEIDRDGTYRFEVTGSNTKGSYKINYKIE